jgi:single-strand DNA-binding protein
MTEYITGFRDPASDDYVVTIVGNLTASPEMRYGKKANTPYAKMTVVANDRGEEQTAQFYTVTTFGSLAENVASSLQKGDRVVVHGTLTWTERNNGDGYFYDISADAVGCELRWAVAEMTKNTPRRATGKGSPPPAQSEMLA